MSDETFKSALFAATLGVGSGILSDLVPGPSFTLRGFDFFAILTGV
jgi:hypothetical protein